MKMMRISHCISWAFLSHRNELPAYPTTWDLAGGMFSEDMLRTFISSVVIQGPMEISRSQLKHGFIHLVSFGV